MSEMPYCKRPCAECPWRADVPLGKFKPARFIALAPTAYDMALTIFACHMSKDEKPVACAGFILMQGAHNFSLRMAGHRFDVEANGAPLFPTYRAMAIANGVKARDPSLRHCRDDGQTMRAAP